MEIEGRIIVVLPEQGGVSARTGNAWKSQDFVIETHEQYPRKCCFRVFGADRLAQFNIQAGEELRVSFDIDAREYQGRWYNDVRAWKVERIDPAAAAGAQPMAAPGAFPPPPAGGFAPAQPAAAVQQPAAAQQSAAPFPPMQPATAENPADDLPF